MNKTLTFFCLGAQKSGTTTLHDVLAQHPDLVLPKYKESHFFSEEENYKRGLEHYFSFHFPKIGNDKIIGEIDPEYLSCPECPTRIMEAFGQNLKFIIILRNPIDRAYSAYLMAKSRGYEKLSFEDALKEESGRLNTKFGELNFSYSKRSRYSSQIQAYFNIFPKKNFHIIKFEDFIQNIELSIENIRIFLDLKPFRFELQKASNVAHEPKSKLLRDFIYKPLWIKAAGHFIIPSISIRGKIMHFLNNKNLRPLDKKGELSNSLRKEIYDTYFKQDIEKLEILINQDLTDWKYK